MIISGLVFAFVLTALVLVAERMLSAKDSVLTHVGQYLDEEFVGEGWRAAPRIVGAALLSPAMTLVLFLCIGLSGLVHFGAARADLNPLLYLAASASAAIQALATVLVLHFTETASETIAGRIIGLRGLLATGEITQSAYEQELAISLKDTPVRAAIRVLRSEYRHGTISREAFVRAKRVVTGQVAFA